MESCPMPVDQATDASGAFGIMHASSPAPSTSVESTHQQHHKQPATRSRGAAGKANKAAATGSSKAKAPRSSSGASGASSSRPAKKPCTASARAKEGLADLCDDDEGDGDDLCELSGSGAVPSAAAAERKGPISHSTVEKQRRDRINALIDLLAEQVPPVSSKYSGSQAAAVRRPKHVVLSDTLALLSKIRSALKDQEQTISRLVAAAGAPAAPAFEPEAQPAGSRQSAPCGSYVAGRPAAAERVEVPVAAVAHMCAAQASPLSISTEAASCAPTPLAFVEAEQAQCSPAAMHATPVVPAAAASKTETDCPDVSVVEQAPGSFSVSLRCPHKPDLYSELCEGLSNLPVTITELRLLPDAAAPAAPATHTPAGAASAAAFEEPLMRASLRLAARPGAFVTADQLQLALYMSVCWSCPQLPPMEDPMGTLVPSAPCPWGTEAAGYLLPQPCVPYGWEACDDLVAGCGPAAAGLHPSSSDASMNSWYDVL